jgi:hypothetical protein
MVEPGRTLIDTSKRGSPNGHTQHSDGAMLTMAPIEGRSIHSRTAFPGKAVQA